MHLPDQLLRAVEREVRRRRPEFVRWATVTQESPLRVKFPADTADTSVKRLSSYSPTLNEQVVLLRVGSRFIAVGGIV